ncbi:MAG: glycosyl hydrolase 53 family protein [Clostridiales bacterium]|nr:glycosyl hydrolase 53 family protein [Clostridiales bacterium]
MKTRKLTCVVICIVMMATCLLTIAACSTKVASDTLYVKKVDGLSKDFVMGMDASSVISLEDSGVKYYDFDGNEADVFKVLADNGINTIRVRVWNDPYDSNGNGFGGGNCDINTAVEIGKRATKYNMGLMVDFHYSDFWADPAKQMVPRAWKGMNIEQKSEALYQYTKESLQTLKDAKVKVSMVQVGNETNAFMCGENKWANIAQLMSAGSKAVREVFPKAQVVLHFANPEKVTNYVSYAKNLDYYGVDYDVFGSSYYPYWHGTLENLSTVLGDIAETYGKKVMVAETSYAFTTEDTDFFGNTIGEGGSVTKNYPYTVQGQSNCIRDIIDTVAHTTNGIGVCYWEGTWITVGGSSWEENSAIWEKHGSGWASSYAKVYDPDDAGKWYGGCAVDNQAFFDKNGKPLESLKVFGLARNGNIVANKADALEDVNLMIDLNSKTIELPAKVNAVMLDDSKQQVDVVWEITEAKKAEMFAGGVAKYDIKGTADGMTVHCYVSMVEYNYLTNYSFEDDANKTKQPTGWTVTEKGNSNELWVEDKVTDSLTGTKHYHFYGASANSINFELEQQVTGLVAGTYKYSISIMGGDCGTTNVYAYVKVNGVIVKQEKLTITVYDSWDTVLIEGIEYTGTETIVVGIHVECAGAGAWGKIDDALFNLVSAN